MIILDTLRKNTNCFVCVDLFSYKGSVVILGVVTRESCVAGQDGKKKEKGGLDLG